MLPEQGFVPTSVAEAILTRMQIVHRSRRIAIFSGPPGIGKTTAINEFVAANPSDAAVVTIRKEKAGTRFVIQNALEAVRGLNGNVGGYIYDETYRVSQQFFQEVRKLSEYADAMGEKPRLTLVFDEAQTLTRSAIEELRHWNDATGHILPFKIGLVFVGNQEFSLKSTGSGQSVISAAVADRARFIETFDYSNVETEDLAAFVRAHGITDPEAVSTIVFQFSGSRAIRSFRRVADLLEDIADAAAGRPVTADIVRSLT